MFNHPDLYRFVWIKIFQKKDMTDVDWEALKEKFPPQSQEDIDELTYGLREEKDFDKMLDEAERSVNHE